MFKSKTPNDLFNEYPSVKTIFFLNTENLSDYDLSEVKEPKWGLCEDNKVLIIGNEKTNNGNFDIKASTYSGTKVYRKDRRIIPINIK